MKLKNKYKSNPFSSNLKRSIEVESWFDKPKHPGYVEIDLGIEEQMDTPFNRVMEIGTISEEDRYNLSKLRESIELIKLSSEIERLAKEPDYIYQKKNGRYNDEHHK